MALTHGAQTVETFPGKRVVKSGAVGATTVEEVKWLTRTLLNSAKGWKDQGWVYMVDISKMSPVTPEISEELVNLHKELEASGCKGMAFIDFGAFVTAAQAKKHQKKSGAGIEEAHFKTQEEALAWCDTILN